MINRTVPMLAAEKWPPTLAFLRRPHLCNYCRIVSGVVFDRPPKVRARIRWLECWCRRRHYICLGCALVVGVTKILKTARVDKCARGYTTPFASKATKTS